MVDCYKSSYLRYVSVLIFVAFLTILLNPLEGFSQGAGNALDFDGGDVNTGEYVSCGSAGELQITGDLTLETWIYLDSSPPGGSAYTFITYGTNGEEQAQNQIYRFEIRSGGPIHMLHESGGSDVGGSVDTDSLIGELDLYGQWVHLAVVRDVTANTFQLFINGEPQPSVDYGTNDPDGGTSGIFIISGAFAGSVGVGTNDPQGYFVEGQMDEIRVWDVARTPAQIQANMNKKLNGTESGLQGYWRLDSSSGITATDQTTNNDGTLVRMEDEDWITSIAPVGDASIFAESANISGTAAVPIDVTFGIDSLAPGSNYSLSTIQVNEDPNNTNGLLTYSPPIYWELWSESPLFDDTFTVRIRFHFDYVPGIGKESELGLYRRDDVNGTWSLIDFELENNGDDTDGSGYLQIYISDDTTGGFSGQYIITSSDVDNPLPIEIASFTANLVIGGVQLEWKTFSEINNAGFEIWRSIDNEEDFNLLSSYQDNLELVGVGNSNTTHEYSYLDHDIQEGHTYYYQLWDVSFSGERVNHEPVSVSVNKIPVGIDEFVLYQNYPNPFNPITYIRFQINDINPSYGMMIPVNLDIYDILGRKVKTLMNQNLTVGDYTLSWDGTNEINQNVASGSYIYVLQIGDRRITKQLIMIR